MSQEAGGETAAAPPPPASGQLDAGLLADVDALLAEADTDRERLYPGDPAARQPVHTVYVPADRVGPGTVADWGRQALAALQAHAPDAASLARAAGLDRSHRAPTTVPEVLDAVHARVLRKLAVQPVEDLRADLEDGYGAHPDDVEDADATRAGAALAAIAHPSAEGQGRRQGQGQDGGPLPPVLVGVRVRGLEPATRRRGLRSLDLALAAYLAGGGDPATFVVTLPKVTSVAQVEAFVAVLSHLEEAHGLARACLRVELQVETPQAVLGPDGAATVARMVHAAGGRCSGLPYGTYDYSAALGVAAEHQSLEHPVADHAKAVMMLAAAGTGARVSDGSTNVLPVGATEQVHAAWTLHARLVRRALERGLYQGWDLHPAQLPTRYLATYLFFRQALPAAAARLRAYVEGTGSGAVLDEPATAQTLAGVAVRALDCGAVDDDEVRELTGLDRGALDVLARRRVG